MQHSFYAHMTLVAHDLVYWHWNYTPNIWIIVVRFRSALRESLLYWNFKYIHEARIYNFSMAICNEARMRRLRPNSLFFILLLFFDMCLSVTSRSRTFRRRICFCIYKTTLSNDWHQVNTTQATTLYMRIYCKYLYVWSWMVGRVATTTTTMRFAL